MATPVDATKSVCVAHHVAGEVKNSVRAMDTVTAFAAALPELGGSALSTTYTVAGASKEK